MIYEIKILSLIYSRKFSIQNVIHFAAESHVDHSIENPAIFAETNVIGTLNLLEAAKLSLVGTAVCL